MRSGLHSLASFLGGRAFLEQTIGRLRVQKFSVQNSLSPLLAPQTDTEADGGSYGLLILNEDEELDEIDTNPEIF